MSSPGRPKDFSGGRVFDNEYRHRIKRTKKDESAKDPAEDQLQPRFLENCTANRARFPSYRHRAQDRRASKIADHRIDQESSIAVMRRAPDGDFFAVDCAIGSRLVFQNPRPPVDHTIRLSGRYRKTLGGTLDTGLLGFWRRWRVSKKKSAHCTPPPFLFSAPLIRARRMIAATRPEGEPRKSARSRGYDIPPSPIEPGRRDRHIASMLGYESGMRALRLEDLGFGCLWKEKSASKKKGEMNDGCKRLA